MTRKKILLPFPKPIIKATFLRRPQRFLAEMRLSDDTEIVAYCPNPGSFEGCLEEGSQALIWDSENPKRKRRYTWKATKVNGLWIGTDTQIASEIVKRILEEKLFDFFDGYNVIETEKTLGLGSRIDFFLKGDRGECFMEVKSATVVKNGTARFPDSVTPRGLKHLDILTEKALEGKRAIQMFLVQRDDARNFSVNESCFPEYVESFRNAIKAGVEIIAIAVPVNYRGVGMPRVLPIKE